MDSKNLPKKESNANASSQANLEAKPPDKKKKAKNKLISKCLIRKKNDKIILGANLVIENGINSFFKKANKEGTNEATKAEAIKNIKDFLKVGNQLDEWAKDPKQASKNKKEITSWAKKILTDDEYNEIDPLSKLWEVPRYTAALSLLRVRFKEFENKIKKKELNREKMNMNQNEFDMALQIFQDEIKKKEEEDDGYEKIPDDPKEKEQVEGIKELEKVWGMSYEQLVQEAKDVGVDIENMDKMDIDDAKKEEDANLKMDKFIDSVDVAELVSKLDPKFIEELNNINNGKIPLKAEKEDKIGKLNDLIINRKNLCAQADSYINSLKERKEIFNPSVTSKEQIRSALNNPLNLSMESVVHELVNEIRLDEKASERELVIALALRTLCDQITTLKNLTFNLMNVLDAKNKEDEEVKKNFSKRPGIVKKINSGNYLPKEEIESMTEVNKQLRNLKDFVQMPKWEIWKKFKEDEKKAYFNERIKWNVARLKFLTDVATGVENNDFQIDVHDIPKALNCHIYYMNKFDSGFRVKKEEWDKLYQAQSEDVKTKLCELRVKGKSILVKLERENKITGMIRYKGEYIASRGKAHFNLELEKIFKNKVQQAQNQQPWIFQQKPARYPQKKNKKFLNKKKERPVEVVDDDENFRSKVVDK